MLLYLSITRLMCPSSILTFSEYYLLQNELGNLQSPGFSLSRRRCEK